VGVRRKNAGGAKKNAGGEEKCAGDLCCVIFVIRGRIVLDDISTQGTVNQAKTNELMKYKRTIRYDAYGYFSYCNKINVYFFHFSIFTLDKNVCPTPLAEGGGNIFLYA